ncbi:MAG: phenylalanine--tRNA ligase subunit alpha [bacterium]|nr:phenylalanine--tRNA ligase subunit alpha [bacterium]MDZ4286284.1 phenylalanine--tRNA ligase subunit alpha [Candidatus Sungbacteria bacterium]
MEKDLAHIQENALQEIKKAQTPEAVEDLRIQYLGRKGALTAILRSLKDLPPEERSRLGAQANMLQQQLSTLLDERMAILQKTVRESLLKKEWVDVTRPGAQVERGHLHPLTKITREMTGIFSSMGFEIVDGPEVETEYYNFDALNIPESHPAREMWDTFWLRGNQNERKTKNEKRKKSERLLLRTHTSPVQIRYMETHNPPFRIIVPGRVYRYEATDVSHDVQFHQIEGLVVDNNVSIASFKAIIQEFFSRLFTKRVTIRLRPSYFPFTEPSFEVDISCVYCSGKGCSICKRTGWLELAGAGMVHPNVFKAAGYNAKEVRGFAFGMGIDRVALMKYNIPDIRFFRSGDLAFLKQF